MDDVGYGRKEKPVVTREELLMRMLPGLVLTVFGIMMLALFMVLGVIVVGFPPRSPGMLLVIGLLLVIVGCAWRAMGIFSTHARRVWGEVFDILHPQYVPVPDVSISPETYLMWQVLPWARKAKSSDVGFIPVFAKLARKAKRLEKDHESLAELRQSITALQSWWEEKRDRPPDEWLSLRCSDARRKELVDKHAAEAEDLTKELAGKAAEAQVILNAKQAFYQEVRKAFA